MCGLGVLVGVGLPAERIRETKFGPERSQKAFDQVAAAGWVDKGKGRRWDEVWRWQRRQLRWFAERLPRSRAQRFDGFSKGGVDIRQVLDVLKRKVAAEKRQLSN